MNEFTFIEANSLSSLGSLACSSSARAGSSEWGQRGAPHAPHTPYTRRERGISLAAMNCSWMLPRQHPGSPTGSLHPALHLHTPSWDR